MILLNSISLALYDYSDRDSTTINNQIIDMAGQVFTMLFAIESCLEIIAKGFIIHKNAYLKNGWGILDFLVVISGYVLLEHFKHHID